MTKFIIEMLKNIKITYIKQFLIIEFITLNIIIIRDVIINIFILWKVSDVFSVADTRNAFIILLHSHAINYMNLYYIN